MKKELYYYILAPRWNEEKQMDDYIIEDVMKSKKDAEARLQRDPFLLLAEVWETPNVHNAQAR